MTLAKILFVLLTLMNLSSYTANPLATETDGARLSGLLEDLDSRLEDLHDRVSTSQVTIRSLEATVNRVVSENAQLKASVNLLEETVSQKAQLDDMSKRLAAVEASSTEPRQPDAASKCVSGEVIKAKDTGCSHPFTEVFGRCVYTDPNKSGGWEEMRQYCRTMDADLAVIDSADFLWHLIRHIQETGQDKNSYWVGGHRKSGTSAFHWVDGSPMKMGTPFWGYWNDFQRQQPYDSVTEIHICLYDKGLYFLHSCPINFVLLPICQRK
ncbi:uncharacterized protein LOC143038224 [Oratosquilla oratoria]|uniref:uncharacterized protein LOC143038224 n=1 Tax=Oratosquilla oratoria TaxID=337810 RepID=UPI003F7712E6